MNGLTNEIRAIAEGIGFAHEPGECSSEPADCERCKLLRIAHEVEHAALELDALALNRLSTPLTTAQCLQQTAKALAGDLQRCAVHGTALAFCQRLPMWPAFGCAPVEAVA